MPLARSDAPRARKLARALRRERLPLAHARAPLIEAGAARLDGADTEGKLREAVATLDALGTMLYATAARQRRGVTSATRPRASARAPARRRRCSRPAGRDPPPSSVRPCALDPSDTQAIELVDQLLDAKPSMWRRIRGALGAAGPAPLIPDDPCHGYLTMRGRAHWRRVRPDRGPPG